MHILLAPLVMLGPVDFRASFFLSFVLGLIRQVFIFGLAIIILFFSFKIFAPATPNYQEMNQAKEETLSSLQSLSSDLTSEYKIDVESVRFEINNPSQDEDSYFYSIDITCDKCRSDGPISMPFFRVVPALKDTLFAKWFPIDNSWPFRELKFDSGAYVTSALLVEAAADPLSGADVEEARRLIDTALSRLPTPTNDTLIWARRLIGPIQIGCYVLFIYGMLRILFTYLSTVAPNSVLRSQSLVSAPGLEVTTTAAGKHKSLPLSRLHLAEEAKESHRESAAEVGADTHDDVGIADSEEDEKDEEKPSEKITMSEIPAPWKQSNGIRGTANDFERFYASVGEAFKTRTGLWITEPILPLTSLRRIGYMAMQCSPRAENVPGFVSVEAEGIYETLDAKNKVVQYIIWAIPTLGFIGTVLGIGDALSATVDIQSSVLSVRANAESNVGASIGVAFDTTFVALILSFIMMLCFYLMQSAQEMMVSYEKRTALEEIIQPYNLKSLPTSDDLSLVFDRINALDYRLSQNYFAMNRPRLEAQTNDTENKKTNLGKKILVFLFIIIFIAFLMHQYGMIDSSILGFAS